MDIINRDVFVVLTTNGEKHEFTGVSGFRYKEDRAASDGWLQLYRRSQQDKEIRLARFDDTDIDEFGWADEL